jgi:hypothetical protein
METTMALDTYAERSKSVSSSRERVTLLLNELDSELGSVTDQKSAREVQARLKQHRDKIVESYDQ